MSWSGASSSSCPPAMPSPEDHRNWSDLPKDLLLQLFCRLGPFDVLRAAQFVCRAWKSASHDPPLWRSVEIRHRDHASHPIDAKEVSREAISRAAGGLVSFRTEYCCSDKFLSYIADRTNALKSIRLISCYSVTGDGFLEFVRRCPSLEEIEITFCFLNAQIYEAAGLLASNLKCFRLNTQWSEFSCIDEFDIVNNVEALAIANSMPELRQLQLIGNKLTNDGLLTILDKCHLDLLDIRRCFNINLDKNLESRLAGVGYVKLPYDSTADIEFLSDAESYDMSKFIKMSDMESYPWGDYIWEGDYSDHFSEDEASLSDLDYLSDA